MADQDKPRTDTKDTNGVEITANDPSASDEAKEARGAHVASNISSSMSGNPIGNMVGNKKMNLLDAMHDAKPQIGRRPEPVNDPWPRRKMFIRGIALGLLVCVVVAVIAVVLAQQSDFGASLV